MRKILPFILMLFSALGYAQLRPPYPGGSSYNKGPVISGQGIGVDGCSNTDVLLGDASGCGNITNLFFNSSNILFPSLCGNTNKPSWCSGSDIGAWINSAYSQLPSSGGWLIVSVPASGYSFSTPIVINTPKKTVLIDCLSNPGTPSVSSAPAITFTPTSGTALTFNNSGSNQTHPNDYGIAHCNFAGSGGTSIGLMLGGTIGAEGFSDNGSSFYGYGTDVMFGNNTWQVVFNHSILQGPGTLLNIPSGLTTFGEHITFNNVRFLQNSLTNMANSVIVQGGGLQFDCNQCSLDNAQYVDNGSAQSSLDKAHFEAVDNSTPLTLPFVVNNGGNLTLYSPQLFSDYNTATASSYISTTAGTTSVIGIDAAANGNTYSSIFSISGAANLFNLSPVTMNGSNNTFISGTTTGRYWIDTGNNCAAGPCQEIVTNTNAIIDTPSLRTTNDTFNRWGIDLTSAQSASLISLLGTNDFSNFFRAKVKLLTLGTGAGCVGNVSSGIGFLVENKSSGSTDTSTQVAQIDCLGDIIANGYGNFASYKLTNNSIIYYNSSALTIDGAAGAAIKFTPDSLTHTLFLTTTSLNNPNLPYDTGVGYKVNGNTVIDSSQNVFAGNGSIVVLRCTTAGTMPVGALTTVAANCGASTDSGQRVK